jgi:hypothetical protein
MAEPVLAWRAWRVLSDEGPQLRAPLGTLYGPMSGQVVPWLDGQHKARCIPPSERSSSPFESVGWDPRPHKAPGNRCECGIRGDLDLAALFAYGSPPRGSFGWHDWREVIGEVELIGRRLPPRIDDTPTTLRAERARVGRRVFFARPLWSFTDAFERLHPWATTVRVEALRDALNDAPLGCGSCPVASVGSVSGTPT